MLNMRQSISIVAENDCTGCFACKAVCNKKAISLRESIDGFLKPIVDPLTCTECGACVGVCPAVATTFSNPETTEAYSFVHPDPEVLKHSTSGGAFSAVAEHFFSKKGVVYGAAFQSDWSVRHIRATNMEELAPIRGSKYVQSNCEDVYRLIDRDLKDARPVLFSGTPCQVAGVNSYFRKHKNREFLLLMDIICHGVNSPIFFVKYIKFLENKFRGTLSFFEFRNKSHDWNRPRVKFVISDVTRSQIFNNNEFISGFRKNIYLRCACYRCKYTRISRQGDLTIGDFWGVPKRFYQGQGVSIILVNHHVGKNILESAIGMQKLDVQNVEYIMAYNPQLSRPSVVGDIVLRELFLKGEKSGAWDALLSGALLGKKFRWVKQLYYCCRDWKVYWTNRYG